MKRRAQLLIQSLRLAADSGELPEWIDHATDVLDKASAEAEAEAEESRPLAMVKEHLATVKARVRSSGGEGGEDESEFVRTYGGSSEAVLARAMSAGTSPPCVATPRLGSGAAVGTIFRHEKYGYRGVIYGYDPRCLYINEDSSIENEDSSLEKRLWGDQVHGSRAVAASDGCGTALKGDI